MHWGGRCRPSRARYPGLVTPRATPYIHEGCSTPICACTRRTVAVPGLSPAPRWALTPPFHPYRGRCVHPPLAVCFLLPVPGVASGGHYPHPCPVVAGLSSSAQKRRQPPARLEKMSKNRFIVTAHIIASSRAWSICLWLEIMLCLTITGCARK